MTREEAVADAERTILADGQGATIISCRGGDLCVRCDPTSEEMEACPHCERIEVEPSAYGRA